MRMEFLIEKLDCAHIYWILRCWEWNFKLKWRQELEYINLFHISQICVHNYFNIINIDIIFCNISAVKKCFTRSTFIDQKYISIKSYNIESPIYILYWLLLYCKFLFRESSLSLNTENCSSVIFSHVLGVCDRVWSGNITPWRI